MFLLQGCRGKWKYGSFPETIGDSASASNFEKLRLDVFDFIRRVRAGVRSRERKNCEDKKIYVLSARFFARDARRSRISTRECFPHASLVYVRARVCVYARRRDSAVLSARSRPATTALGADWRWSGNVAGGIDSAPQPQPHVCRRAAMIPKPCNGFSAVTRKPLPTTRHDDAGRLRLFRLPISIQYRVLPINRLTAVRSSCEINDGAPSGGLSFFSKFLALFASNSGDYFFEFFSLPETR